jgi:DNA-binding transcriptional regulator YdaS (Cro superfamily)
MSDLSPIQRAVQAAGTQPKLAEISGLSQQFISKVVRGERRLSSDSALAISRATGIPLSDLLPEIVEAVRAELERTAIDPAPGQTGAAA